VNIPTSLPSPPSRWSSGSLDDDPGACSSRSARTSERSMRRVPMRANAVRLPGSRRSCRSRSTLTSWRGLVRWRLDSRRFGGEPGDSTTRWPGSCIG
jgi:hypothetical protein